VFEGSLVALITPITAAGGIDEAALDALGLAADPTGTRSEVRTEDAVS